MGAKEVGGRTAPGEAVIEVRGLVAGYGDSPILSDVSFTVRERELLVVLGPSGCGKSTLLRCLIGLLPPRQGEIRLFGQDIAKASEEELDGLRRRIGVSFQSSALLGSMTVGENVSLPLREHTSLDPATVTIMMRLKLGNVGLAHHEDTMPAELSGGMKKRAGIARAIAMDPKCLLLDEPSAGLDPITAAGLDKLLLDLRAALGLTMVVVTHELQSAFALADRVLVLDRGVVLLDADADEARRTRHPRVRQLLDRQPDAEEADPERLVEELTR